MNIKKATIRQSPFIGIFAIVTEKIGFFPLDASKKELKGLQEFFGVEVIQTSLANSSLIGVIAIANSKGLIVSNIVEAQELNCLEEVGVRVKALPTVAAIGNLIELNDNKGICSTIFNKKTVKEIERFLSIKLLSGQIAGNDLIGASIVCTNKGFIVNPMVSEKEFNKIKKHFKLNGSTATGNYGDKFVANNIIANSRGALVGTLTSGHELIRIDAGLSGRG